MRIVNPSGSAASGQNVIAALRAAKLAGGSVAILDNGKPNAGYVVRRLGEHLSRHYATQVPVAVGKALASRPAPDEVLDGFRGFDAAVVGVGD